MLNSENVLTCPKCGDFNLHHSNVEIFNRDKEDAKEGLHVETHDQLVFVDRDMADNPSSRRNGFRILFSCESCHTDVNTGEALEPDMWLMISQHKGATEFCWEVGNQ